MKAVFKSLFLLSSALFHLSGSIELYVTCRPGTLQDQQICLFQLGSENRYKRVTKVNFPFILLPKESVELIGFPDLDNEDFLTVFPKNRYTEKNNKTKFFGRKGKENFGLEFFSVPGNIYGVTITLKDADMKNLPLSSRPSR